MEGRIVVIINEIEYAVSRKTGWFMVANGAAVLNPEEQKRFDKYREIMEKHFLERRRDLSVGDEYAGLRGPVLQLSDQCLPNAKLESFRLAELEWGERVSKLRAREAEIEHLQKKERGIFENGLTSLQRRGKELLEQSMQRRRKEARECNKKGLLPPKRPKTWYNDLPTDEREARDAYSSARRSFKRRQNVEELETERKVVLWLMRELRKRKPVKPDSIREGRKKQKTEK